MNTDNDLHFLRDAGDAELRMALRGLRRDIEPGQDLWPGVATRLQPHGRASASSRSRWLWPVSLAASMLLAGGLAWQMQPPGLPPTTAGRPATAGLVQQEADVLTVHYEAALREFAPATMHANWQPGLEALDRSANEIREALKKNPDSRLLLERLRGTYTRRLALSRRALYA
ncbi:MAG: hypothetical protein EON48_00985 [Acetobacteraceae bacterium]|nr:MAG: hypothetical protein EON48_00985 [Acetobacteraceae bacterium]